MAVQGRMGWKRRDDQLELGCRAFGDMLTPCACVGVVDGGVDVAEVDFAHEAVYLG